MNIRLFKDLDKDTKAELQSEFKKCAKLREQIVKVLEEDRMREFKEMDDKKIFDSPSWSHKQANSLGYCRAVRDLISLIDEKN